MEQKQRKIDLPAGFALSLQKNISLFPASLHNPFRNARKGTYFCFIVYLKLHQSTISVLSS
ncbi:MAG: hypothetical protein EZS26_003523 [Candidatus Ordinivivax streblomastigis]|uniref:Uncharacterized protein n=1 Tax=Candidatus Ordinivivax streblomastigis TaxID=2540710 RepID=A0A5M8NUA5_9BACT|nr:MAG: hypothetical protein EZS26_003523 [Candidatus Ordinivivax streblomastigis]